MQSENGVKKSPYKGIIIVLFFLVIVPILFYFLFYYIIDKYQAFYGDKLNKFASLFLGFGVGFIFQLSCIIGGLFKGCFIVVIKRIIGFFDNVRYSFKMAVKLYFDDIRENGIVFWLMFPIVFTTFCICLYGFFGYISIM